MVSALQPLLPRGRYTDPEWALASAGRCDRNIANYPHVTRCGKESDPDSFYRWCTDHDAEARDDSPHTYGN